MADKMWVGNPPEKCDFCGKPISTVFVDGATQGGPWACMCLVCHRENGCGLGQGRGQKYERKLIAGFRDPDSPRSIWRWVKVEG